MKRFVFLTKGFFIGLLLLLFTCEHKFRNPLDANTELKPDEWAPKNLTVTALDDSHIKLTWIQEEEQIEGFIIERKDNTANYKEVGRSDTTGFTDDSLKIGTNYIYKVSAYAERNNSTPIISSAVQTFFPAPTELSRTNIDDQSVKLNWKDNCAFETGYRIERKSGSSAYLNVAETDKNITEYIDTSLAYGITYTYRVSAITQYNVSGFSNELTAQTIFPAPTNLVVTAINDQSIRIDWVDNCVFELGFRVEHKVGNGSFTQVSEVAANVTLYEENSLTYGETYTYRVRAYTSLNQSDYSNESLAKMVIPAPTDLNAVAIDDQTIKLTWTDNCLFESGFKIERKAGSSDFVQVAEVTANTTTYEESGLTYGETYTYRIRAYTSINQSDYSNENSARMIIQPPSNLTLTTNETILSISLTWTDNCSFEVGFRIECKIGSGNFVQIAEVSLNTTEYTDGGLGTGLEYTYRVRAYTLLNQSNYSNEETGYINETITDIDGNVYKTVKIGTQVWMAENLKVTHYRNGDPILNITDNTQWDSLTTGAYCNYNNDPNNAITYGRLYNWYAVTDSRNLAPIGWRVPTDAEWQTLINYLGGDDVAGGKIKEAGTTHWSSPNTGATNESGFTALPGGYRYYYGYFLNLGDLANFWSSTESNSDDAWYRVLYFNNANVYRCNDSKRSGLSVRLVRD